MKRPFVVSDPVRIRMDASWLLSGGCQATKWNGFFLALKIKTLNYIYLVLLTLSDRPIQAFD